MEDVIESIYEEEFEDLIKDCSKLLEKFTTDEIVEALNEAIDRRNPTIH